MSNKKHRFIVFEGLDGAGTTTQAAMLHDYFTRSGLNSFLTFEPTDAPVGGFIRDLLDRRIPREHPSGPVTERVMGLLFAADRLGHSIAVRSALDQGRPVVCDRYIFSSLAYQTLDPGLPPEWVVGVNRGCAIPDLTLYVSVPVNVCMERIGGRGDETSVYEKQESLETISQNYERLLPFYESHFGKTVVIDGTPPPETVHASVLRALSTL